MQCVKALISDASMKSVRAPPLVETQCYSMSNCAQNTQWNIIRFLSRTAAYDVSFIKCLQLQGSPLTPIHLRELDV